MIRNWATGRGLAENVDEASIDLDLFFDQAYRDLENELKKEASKLGDTPSEEIKTKVIYKTQADDRVRPEHARLHNTVWDADDPNLPRPPLGYGCRCYLEFRAASAEEAEKSGGRLQELEIKNPPKPGAEALQRFISETEVPPADIFGKKVGKLIEEGKIPLERAFDDAGDSLRLTRARVESLGGQDRTKNARLKALDELNGLGINEQQVEQLAREAIKSASPRNYLMKQLEQSKPALVGNTRLVKQATDRIMRTGLTKLEAYDAPPAGPVRMLGPDGRPITEPAKFIGELASKGWSKYLRIQQAYMNDILSGNLTRATKAVKQIFKRTGYLDKQTVNSAIRAFPKRADRTAFERFVNDLTAQS